MIFFSNFKQKMIILDIYLKIGASIEKLYLENSQSGIK